MSDKILSVEHLSKTYRLGQIGGTTLREEIQRLNAKLKKKEDPTAKIGAGGYEYGESFKALKDISFDIEKGERVGIIGKNGAGKSTLLKLISRITAPTSGDIWMNGRVASMLEVGTGFHGELTGRENIYMNGAILGMKKREIDEKIEDIIDFSECRQFIDTPVKRYSSGMYVKLAFSVAAHLDSEIMIMDEVLAVGDMAFQKKCLEKMNEVSKKDNRTILYVSHNMFTIRQLCNRCIVLEKGGIIFDGDVDSAIGIYMGASKDSSTRVDLNTKHHEWQVEEQNIRMTFLECLECDDVVFNVGAEIRIGIGFNCKKKTENVYLRFTVTNADGTSVTMMTTNHGVDFVAQDSGYMYLNLDISMLVPGQYYLTPTLYNVNEFGQMLHQDVVHEAFLFEIQKVPGFNNNMEWHKNSWGYFYNKPIDVSFQNENDYC